MFAARKLAIVVGLLTCFGVALSGQTTRPANAILAITGEFSLVAAPGWGKKEEAHDAVVDLVLVGPQSSWGTNAATGQIVTAPATLKVTHATVGPRGDIPKGITLEMFRRDLIAREAEAGIWAEFLPEPASHLTVDGHEALSWLVTKSVNGGKIKAFEVSVFVGARLYNFVLQAGGASDFSSVLEDLNRMLATVKFR